ncbi:MAG: Omp28-related outer membrane protein, partial [Flavobacteriales bacterium]|nr:Omp28-related outer membrane protein [Flavobacteriales bacterium]
MSSPANKILDVPAASQTFTYYGADLSAWAGQPVYIAWRNNSNDKFILYVDDIQVLSIPNTYDVSVQSVNMDRFVRGNTNVNVNITIMNGVGQPVNSLTVQWSDGTNTYTQNLTGLNIPPLGTYTFNHSTPFNKNVAGEFDIVVTASNPNGQADANPADNSKSAKVSTIVNQVTKVVVIEEGTGTWCGWCPRGFTAMEQLHNTYPSTFAGIAVHNGDPMVVGVYDGALGISGFPGCHVERHLKDASVTPSLFQQYYADYSTIWPPASLTVTPTLNGNSLSVSVKADFVTTCSEEFRLAVVLTEDGVKGNIDSYNQANYYAGGNVSLPYGNIDFRVQPDPVPYTTMWYDHTARALLGGFNGQANSIPAGSFVANGSTTYTFNYTIPAAYDKNKMEAIALLIHTATGRIWNAGKAKLVSSVSTEEPEKPLFVTTLFPNPAKEVV